MGAAFCVDIVSPHSHGAIVVYSLVHSPGLIQSAVQP